jgi:hypothetical protein
MNQTQHPGRPDLKLIVNPFEVCRPSVFAPVKQATVMGNDDIYIDYLLYGASKNVHNPDLHYFLVAVLSQTEVRQVLTRSVVVKGMLNGPRIAQLLPIAKHFQQMNFCAAGERDAIYVSTILHGIAFWLKPCVQGDTSVQEVMCTIVKDSLRRLDRQSPALSQTLRLCMDWGNVDEESAFTELLQERMHRAICVLDDNQI